MKNIPTDHALDLLLAIEAGLNGSTVQRMALLMESAGLWSPAMPVSQEGHTLAQAWFRSLSNKASGAMSIPNEQVFQWLVSLQPSEELWNVRMQPNTLGGRLIQGLGDMRDYEKGKFLERADVWEALPVKALQGFHSNFALEGQAILHHAVSKDRPDLVEVLLNRGWNWGRHAEDIKSVPMWQLFLNSGGDPRQVVRRGDPGDNNSFRGPLWQYFAQRSYGSDEKFKELKELTEAFGRKASPALFEAEELRAYWAAVSRRLTLADLSKAVNSRKDWDVVRNNEGQNVLMVAMGHHKGMVSKLAEKAKGQKLFADVDKRGWSMWHYMFGVEGRPSWGLSEWSQVLASSPAQPDPARGLVATVMLDNEEKFNQFAFPITQGLLEKPKAPTAEQFWGGTPEVQDRLAKMLMGRKATLGSMESMGGNKYYSSSQVVKNLSYLAHHRPLPSDATALLRGAVALYVVLASNQSEAAPLTVADELIRAGARLDMDSEVQSKVEIFLSHKGPEANARYRALTLGTTLEVTPSSPPPKPRF